MLFYGGAFKPTGWLSNAPFFATLRRRCRAEGCRNIDICRRLLGLQQISMAAEIELARSYKHALSTEGGDNPSS